MADPVLGPTADGDVYRIIIRQNIFGQRVLNVLWYEVSDAGGAPPDRWAAQIGLANAINAAGSVIPLMQDVTSAELEFETVRVSSYRALADRVPYSEVVISLFGDLAGAANLSNVALSIEKRAPGTGAHPRRGIGRFQLGGIPSDKYEQGVFKNDYLALVQPLADELTEDITAVGVTWRPVLVTWGPDNIQAHPIFGTSVKRTVRDMRRRTVGVGE